MRHASRLAGTSLVSGLLLAGAVLGAAPPAPSGGATSVIRAALKPKDLGAIIKDRDIIVHASLDSVSGAPKQKGNELKKYSYYAAMKVNAPLTTTRRVLTDYKLYAKLIPYIDRADYNEKTHLLQLEGGIFGFHLSSVIQFTETSDHSLHYRIVSGHFTGLTGDILFEPETTGSVPGTLTYFNGELSAYSWPPTFVIERGAEIVFWFTGRHMRTTIESPDQGVSPSPVASDLPQPRKQL